MKNPYVELGIDENASLEEIKKAYRQKSKETHPDKEGGSDEAFKKVNEAYKILEDPERRKKFDETGSIEDFDDDKFVISKITELFFEVIDAYAHQIDVIDIVEVLIKSVNKGIENGEKQKIAIKATIERLEATVGNIKRKDGEENLFDQLLNSRIQGLKYNLEMVNNGIERSQKMKEIIEGYESNTDIFKDFDSIGSLDNDNHTSWKF